MQENKEEMTTVPTGIPVQQVTTVTAATPVQQVTAVAVATPVQQSMSVTLPANAVPGMTMQVTSPQGRSFNFEVPKGSLPGTTINVMIPKPSATIVMHQGAAASLDNDWMIPNIFACLFCFWPTALFGIIKSTEARSAAQRGDQFVANASANSAKTLFRVSVGVGVVLLTIIIIIIATSDWGYLF